MTSSKRNSPRSKRNIRKSINNIEKNASKYREFIEELLVTKETKEAAEIFDDSAVLFLEDVESDEKNLCLLEVKKNIITLSLNKRIREIFLFINSNGGVVGDFLSLYDAIMVARNKFDKVVFTIVNGVAYSGAAIVLQAGTERLATAHSSIMLHGIQVAMDLSTLSKIDQFMVTARKTEAQIFKIFADASGHSVGEMRQLVDLYGPDWYLTPTEAKKYGIIDRILK